MLNLSLNNITETPCNFKIKATGEIIQGFKMQSNNGDIDYIANNEYYTCYDSNQVEELTN